MQLLIKHLQNTFYNMLTWIKLWRRLMCEKFYGILTILILALTSITAPIVISYFTASITIKNSGKILIPKIPITYKSEIRGVFFEEGVFGYSHNWTLVAETLANYSINAVFVQDSTPFNRQPYAEIRSAIDAFHAHGIEYHACTMVLGNCRWDNYSTSTCQVNSQGEPVSVYYHCPIKAHDYVIAAIEDYIETFPDVDGIMLDYIRYTEFTHDVCFCQYCRSAFDEWYYQNYGQHVSNWTEFYEGGSKHNIYLEWRSIPINTLVKDIHDTIKSINPNIIFSVCVWTLFSDCPIYWRQFLGQDTAYWIKEGYVDFVAPMMYTSEIYGETGETLQSEINANIKYWMGGQPEGPIPLVAVLDSARKNTPESLKAQIEYVRTRGLDGWILWHYGGPGVDRPNIPDIRDYLSLINMPKIFQAFNIRVEVNANNATISWLTNLPTASRLEYSTNPLFGATFEIWRGFNYWNITRAQSDVIENNTYVKIHTITLTDLKPETKYYFRVQSFDESNVVTSKLMIFSTSTS
jgi:hypothetical protein